MGKFIDMYNLKIEAILTKVNEDMTTVEIEKIINEGLREIDMKIEITKCHSLGKCNE